MSDPASESFRALVLLVAVPVVFVTLSAGALAQFAELLGGDGSASAIEANTAWTREAYAATEPYRADGRWLNYYTDDEDANALQAAYGVNGPRLAQVKRRYDPDNVFHLNQNIAPAPVEEAS